MPFDSEATVEFVIPERLPPPVCDTRDIAVAAPPEVSRPQSNRLIRLLPIVTAVVTVGAMAAAYYARSAVARNPAFMMFPVMMLMSAVAAVFSGVDRRRNDINIRRADFLDHLSTVRAAALKVAAAQHHSSTWCHPEPDMLWTLVGGRRMWERRAPDADFCQVRIGTGTLPLSARLAAPTSDSVKRVDPMGLAALHSFLDTHSKVSNMPITIALCAAGGRERPRRRKAGAGTSARHDLPIGCAAQSGNGVDCRRRDCPQPARMGVVEMVATQPTSPCLSMTSGLSGWCTRRWQQRRKRSAR